MTDTDSTRIGIDIPGLESVLHGGVLAHRSYLVSGGPGAGKTTLGLHFLASAGDGDGLLISLGEAQRNLRRDADSIGLRLDQIEIMDLSPGTDDAASYDLLEPWEAEAPDIRTLIKERFPDGPPKRVFIDALSQLRQLTPDGYQFRKQVLGLLEYLNRAGSTVLYTAERGSAADEDLRYLGDGILELRSGDGGRRLQVLKFRGSGFAEGEHTLKLGGGGMRVFQRLAPGEHSRTFVAEALSSGIPALDTLMGGGLDRGTVTIISGPTGVGKTSLAIQFLREAARRGEDSVVFSFEESLATLRHRCEITGTPLADMINRGTLRVEEVEPLHYSPDEFAWRVRDEVERKGARMVMLDSLSGFGQSMRGDDVSTHVHALCRYLTNMGITVLVINEHASIAGGELRVSDHGISYLADTILLLRYMELRGELRKSIGVLKKRTGDFEKTLREFRITGDGLRIGEPLTGLRGILHGVPTVAGTNTAPDE